MNLLELFAPIRTFVFDVDGVLTDGSILSGDDGRAMRSMNIKDAYAMQMAIKKGYKVWVLSNTGSEGIKLRLQGYGITDIHTGIEAKKDTLQEIAVTLRTAYESVLYMGDDIPDYAAMKICGLPCCPNDAVPEIRQLAKYISPFKGGQGCVRDVIEKVLKLNGDWELPT